MKQSFYKITSNRSLLPLRRLGALLLWLLPLWLSAQTSTQNYIVTTVPFQPVTDPTTLIDANSNTTIQYFDGLGRPSQMVQRAITPTSADLVSGIEYDPYGRDCRHWLPGAAAGNNGAYVSDFGAKATSTNGGDANPYVETILESSPLNRPLGQRQPGVDWYTHPTGIDYQTNDGSILYFYVNSNNQLAKGSNNYATGSLYVTKVTDEDGKTGYEFKDKQGRVILKRQSYSGGNVDTYYVYNDLNQLSYVIPPKAVDELTDFSDDNAIMKQYCYLYKYDERGNCIYKRLPGCTPIYMVYDRADRLVLSLDGNQRKQPQGTPTQWTVTKYDSFGRTVFTGLMYRNEIDSTQNYKSIRDILSNVVVSESYSDFSTATPLTISYYDNYNFIPAGNNLNYDSSQEQNGYTAQYSNAKGLLTGTRVYHLDNPSLFETTALYYDKYGRVVQSRATNHLGGYDLVYNELKFTGAPARTLKTHNIAGQASVVELYTYDYDKAQRPTTTKYSLNGGGEVTLASNSYDELGRLKTKTLGGIDATTYSYNVRSWTTDIVGSRFSENLYYNANTVGLPNFTPMYNGNIAGMQWGVANESGNRAYSFTYDGLNRLTDAIYTGFSGGVINGTQNRYDEHFGFDKMGNTTSFTRNGLLSSSGGYGAIDNLSFTYNGNQKVKIVDAGTNGIFYGDEEFVQNGTNTGNSCAFDANGNRLYDSNSNIWGIRYNTLNLPDAMQFYQGHQTNYTYSASGAKLKVIDKTAPEGVFLPVTSLNTIVSNPSVSTITTTDYVGNMIYENGVLKRILTPVGYWQAGTFYYFLKDHLGSNRVVMTGSGGIAETSSYYPSGMRFGESAVNGGSVQPYRHTGHEMQEMHGLNWIDNLARFRTVSDGSGFTGVDPLCEKYYSISPYAYCGGDPVNTTDPTGLDWYQDSNGNAFWQEGSEETVVRNDVTYSNVGANYSYSRGNTTYSFEQNEMTSMYVSVLDKDQFQTQFDSRFGNEDRQKVACKRACDVMEGNANVTSSGRNDASQQVGREVGTKENHSIVPTGNLNKGNETLVKEVQINGDPVIVGVDRGKHGRGINDGTTDHWIVISGYTYDLKNNTTTYNYFDPGNKNASQGTNTANVLTRTYNGLLINANGRRTYTVTNVRPNR